MIVNKSDIPGNLSYNELFFFRDAIELLLEIKANIVINSARDSSKVIQLLHLSHSAELDLLSPKNAATIKCWEFFTHISL